MGFEAYNHRPQQKPHHQYTPEQVAFLAKKVKGRGNQELADIFNAHFGLSLTLEQIKTYKANHHLSSGLNGRFKPGHVPANKGLKGVGGWPPTQFKKGSRPANWVPIGSERVNGDGYVDIKVAEGMQQKNWKGKHILIWEAANGPVPEGHAIIFGDGNRRNFDLENLILVSRKQLVRLNQKRLIQNDAGLTRAGILIADIHNRIGERKRAGKRQTV